METIGQSSNPASVPQGGLYRRLAGTIRAHPVLLLVLLTPGIPEYLSGSSSWTVLIANPVLFAIFALLNIGLYTNGVILIREAVLRWQKGWASVFLLGVAYGIVEEGLSLQTLFNSNAQPVGQLGYYGHWLGVNWVWTAGLLLFHATISIGLPILLFGLALPNYRTKNLVSLGRQKVCLGLMLIDCFALFLIVRYWPGWTIMTGSFLIVIGLILAAKRVPAALGKPSAIGPVGIRKLIVLGFLFFPVVLLTGGISSGVGIPPIIPIVIDALFAYFLARIVRRSVTPTRNEIQKLALALGLVGSIVLFGFIATAGVTVVADVGVLLFLRHVWKRCRRTGSSAQALSQYPQF